MRNRKRILGTAARPRLSVFRGLKNISAQLIDDSAGRTLAAAATAEKGLVKAGGNIAAAKVIGQLIAERARAKGIKKIVFDRGQSLYHGRVKALAEAAREGGLEF
ncbi:50S ribosomal protein L18 [candidate division WOR-1 bacterium RIFCSPHIGHO2_01_FULL_53_15]|uniref:Large ribosomal subunit protein uL18 n=1 Tax=candidate division WOR-1 bacterium RIFCSPHIGHO2_01_FULL_53_15 TaxID=1802564 RepID=A0A1F4Q405_UNCSA|nr:MAG: 50S ribosomal protein L18 [candidate division WOR-1 bacterium RIFCSPHIGHO2_01_FULL_53_15]OGC12500.1 MAG: 50S ribosomal protein L18 [candidate division WOR-1 bacterium RIFCSPHIGHO2_02_FULL_53_26]